MRSSKTLQRVGVFAAAATVAGLVPFVAATAANAAGVPTVTNVSPRSVPAPNGGPQVTVTGTNFTSTGTTVTISPSTTGGTPGTTAAQNVTPSVASSTSLTFNAPPAAAGTYDITVTVAGTGNGTSARSTADELTYVTIPTVGTATTDGVNPDNGPTGGGTFVAITGTGFTSATSVTFGGVAAQSFQVNSDTSISAVSPAHAAGETAVVVSNANGSSQTTPGTDANGNATDVNDGFFYTNGVVVTSVTPSTGSTTGGDAVVINGSGFTGVNNSGGSVTFGGQPASFVATSDTQIQATTPAHAAGTVNVVVTRPAGSDGSPAADSGTTGNGKFTYSTAATGTTPVLTSVNPNNGKPGQQVILIGSGFTGATQVDFGGTPAASYTVNSDTSITTFAPTPPNGTGAVTVEVVKGSLNSGTTMGANNTFTYNASSTAQAQPVVTSIAPTTGPSSGGNVVTITGSGFTGTTGAGGVKFGTQNALRYNVNSDTQISAVAPPQGAQGATVQVTVTNGGGTSASATGATYTYTVASPTVTSVTPNSGDAKGGTAVTVNGTNFQDASGANNVTSVHFGSVAAPQFVINSATQLVVISPSSTVAGIVNITVTTTAGTSPVTTADQFTYTGTPAVNPTLSASATKVAYGTTVTLSGTAAAGSTVNILFKDAQETTYTSRRSLTADSSGAFSTTYIATKDERYYATVGTQMSNAGLTQVAPVISSSFPLSQRVPQNSGVTVTGTAGPDSRVAVFHFHAAGTAANDYSIVRPVPVLSNGTFSKKFAANTSYRFFVTTTNGLSTANYLVQD